MVAQPPTVQALGKLVQIGGWAMYVRRLTGADLFRVTLELEHGERAEADFFVREGKVLLMFTQAGILMPFGGGDIGRAKLQAALQAALKPTVARSRGHRAEASRPVAAVASPAPVAAVASPELAEWREARAAWLERRNLENARRLNRATAALQARR